MTITTQDGRKLTINTANKIECYASVSFHDGGKTYSHVWLRELVKDSNGETIAVNVDEEIGRFENSHAWKIVDCFHAALKAGITEFIVPQQSGDEAIAIAAYDSLMKFIETPGRFTQATPEETAIGLHGYERAKAIRLAKETDYWERRNVLIFDDEGSLIPSFKKWQALQERSIAS